MSTSDRSRGARSPDPALRPPTWAARIPVALWLVVFAAAVWALRGLGYVLVDRPGGLAVVWPAAGLFLYALLVTRRRVWPLVAGVSFAIGFLGSLGFGRPAADALAYNAANVAEAVVAAWVVVRVGGRPTLRTLRGTLALTLGATLALLVTSAIAHVALFAGRASFAEERFWVFWAGSSLGTLLVTTLLVEWSAPPSAAAERASAPLHAGGIAAALAAAIALLRLSGIPADDVLLVPPLLWAAFRFGARGATAALLASALGLVAITRLAAAAGVAVPGVPSTTLGLQALLWILAMSILAVAAVGEERRAAERRRVLLERAMDQIPDAAAIYEEDGTVVWANEEAARHVGVSRDALVGARIWELSGGTAAEWREHWERVAAAGALITQSRLPGPGPGRLPFEVASAVARDGERPLMISVLRDLTDRRRAEEASRLAALGTLAAGVAHEINNPLSYVVSNLAHVQEVLAALPDSAGRLREEVREPLAEAVEGARRVRDIVSQLRSFARADEGVGPVDPARALRAALAMAQVELRHRARVVTELAETAPVNASENRLTQVFLNLLVNAAQAIPEGHADRNEVRAVLGARDGEVVVEISDTGHGMSEETRARIFEPFFTTKALGEGTGLGLAISHSIVTGLGGRIEVESAPGTGSRFRVFLPSHDATAAPTKGSAG